MIKNRYCFRRDAFTLVEVLVALAVLSLLVILLATMLSGVMATWQQAEARDERRSVARRSLNLMAQDIGMAALPSNRADTNSLQFVIDPPAATLSGYLLPHAFFGQAPAATDLSASTTQGDLAIFGYFIQWVGTDACLCRLLVNPSSTAYSSTSPNYAVYTNPTGWLTNALPSGYQWASSAKSYAGLVGENVLGLWAQALDNNGNPILTTAAGSTTNYAAGAYDSRLGYSVVTNAVTNVYGPSALPAAVRVGVVVIDSHTAQRLTAPLKPAAATTNFFGDIQKFVSGLPHPIQQGAEIYTQVVPLSRLSQ